MSTYYQDSLQVSFIWVTLQHEGFHAFQRAGEEKQFEDVSFLANRHRHIFHVKVSVQVFNDDRDIEFIQFKRFLQTFSNYDNGSCEQICDRIYDHIKWNSGISLIGKRRMLIEVSEDNENGAFKIYEPVMTTATYTTPPTLV